MRTRSIAVQMVLPLLAALTIAGCGETSGPDSPRTTGTTTAPASGATSTPAPTDPAATEPAATDPTAATGPTVAELEALVDQAQDGKPYSAQLRVRSLLGGKVAVVMSGRLNFNGPLSGHLKLRTTALGGEKPIAVDELIVNSTVFVRQQKPTGPWQRVPKSVAGAAPITDPSQYARLLLALGPSAVKGQENRGGEAVTLLSGMIKTKQVRKIEPSLYDELRTSGVKKFACDIWIDQTGRMVRLEQWLRIQGMVGHNIMTISKFRDPVTVKRPI